jgi:ubiquinol-cytochrome c reductase iron-sulfur subunit
VPRAQERCFAHAINLNMIDSDYNAPASEKTLYRNEFIQQHPSKHAEDMKTAKKPPVVHDTLDLSPAHAGDPHNTYGVADWRYVHYDVGREPTFPRTPDVAKGELAAGANVVRTDVWADPKEPAISSIAKFDPNYFRPVGWAENAPNPVTTVPEGVLDFRANRLPLDHADRRPWVYFVAATTGCITAALVRVTVAKLVHTLWPAKDVFAAGIVEVDLRPIEVGQNFTVKWRNKPVFILRRTEEMVEKARADDPIVASMRDPETDVDRCKKPEYLIVIGVCTHLGCIPQPLAGNFGGYFCPCHGSHYDLSGRLRQGPAPKNLEVPPNSYLDDFTVKLG